MTDDPMDTSASLSAGLTRTPKRGWLVALLSRLQQSSFALLSFSFRHIFPVYSRRLVPHSMASRRVARGLVGQCVHFGTALRDLVFPLSAGPAHFGVACAWLAVYFLAVFCQFLWGLLMSSLWHCRLVCAGYTCSIADHAAMGRTDAVCPGTVGWALVAQCVVGDCHPFQRLPHYLGWKLALWLHGARLCFRPA